MSLRVDWDFIIEKKGKQGLKKIEDKMEKLGYPLKHKDIKPMAFYPIGMAVISLLLIQETFNFNKKDIEEWGYAAVKFSFFVKIFMKYFGSLKSISSQVSNIWRKHYTIGDLEMPDFSKEKRYVILRLKNFKLHPIFCNIYLGYFSRVTKMVIKQPAKCKETKCMFKGDPYHEFLITW